jgi:hypothetical protein
MEPKRSPHEFLTVSDLDNFNDKVSRLMGTEPKKEVVKPETSPKITHELYNREKFDSFLVKPEELEDSLLYQLADIIDKKSFYSVNDFKEVDKVGPSTTDRLLNSISVAYVLYEGIPVGVATIVDPTKENYKGIIPLDYYELKTGKSLAERNLQEFFAVAPEYHNKGISGELRKLILSESPKVFVLNSVRDKETQHGLYKNDYKLIARINTEWEQDPVEVWIN